MTYVIRHTCLENDYTTSYSIVLGSSFISKELNMISSSYRLDSHYYRKDFCDLLKQSLITGDWEEFIRKNGSLVNEETLRKYSFYNYNPERIPSFHSLAFEPTLKINSKHSHQLVYTASLPSLPESLYPIAVRYIDSLGNYYIERPPFQIEVDMRANYRKTDNGKKLPQYKVWIPWSLTVYNPAGELYIYFSHSSLSSYDQSYFNCILPNIYNDARVCFSNSLYGLTNEQNSPDDIRTSFSYMFNEYMNGGWNLDLSPNLERYLGRILSNMSYQKIEENYPTLHLFLNPTESYLRSHFPKMRSNQLKDYCYYYKATHSVAKYYSYMFTMMSTFTLEQTLQFYKDISNAHEELNKDILDSKKYKSSSLQTFQSILNHHKRNDDKLNIYTKFIRELNTQVSISSDESIIREVVNLGYLTNIVFVNYHVLNSEYHCQTPVSSFIKSIPKNVLLSLMEFLSKNNLSLGDYIIYDFSTHQFTLEKSIAVNLPQEQRELHSDYFSNLVKKYSGTPVEQESTL